MTLGTTSAFTETPRQLQAFMSMFKVGGYKIHMRFLPINKIKKKQWCNRHFKKLCSEVMFIGLPTEKPI